MKKLLSLVSLFLVLTMLVPLFASCKKGGKDDEETTYDLEHLVAHDVQEFKPKAWGIDAFKVSTTQPGVASAVLSEDKKSVTITSYNPGKADILVSDCFDHAAVIHVTAAKDDNCTISCEYEKFSGTFLNARSFGCLPNTGADVTSALQKAVDKSAEKGEPVFLYPGIYNVGNLIMKEGAELVMYSGVEDARDGFTDELAEKAANGELTVLYKARIKNCPFGANGNDGVGNFKIKGGVVDADGVVASIVLLSCASNITFEDVIFKDPRNDHIIQFSGCHDCLVKNCVFTGYVFGGDYSVFTREMIQIESANSGAHGGTNSLFGTGEQHFCSNITIEHSYFGKSDQEEAPLIAIGHHGAAGDANCVGVYIKDNVFDECKYAGIRFANMVNVEITGNKFIAGANKNPAKDSAAKTPAEIVIYAANGTYSYTADNNKRSITYAYPIEQSGTHNVTIADNEFIFKAGTDKRLFEIEGYGTTPGMAKIEDCWRRDTFDGTDYKVSGYAEKSNYMGPLFIRNNTITYEGKPSAATNYFINLKNVLGYEFTDNVFNMNGVTFENSGDGINGLRLANCKVYGPESKSGTIVFDKSSIAITFNTYDVVAFKAHGGAASVTMTLEVTEGGTLSYSYKTGKDATVTPVPDEGFVFDGWYDESGAKIGADLTVSKACKITAKFIAG